MRGNQRRGLFKKKEQLRKEKRILLKRVNEIDDCMRQLTGERKKITRQYRAKR